MMLKPKFSRLLENFRWRIWGEVTDYCLYRFFRIWGEGKILEIFFCR
jgi:hypothetical protein